MRTTNYIVWKKWSWKSLFATLLTVFYDEIFINYTIRWHENFKYVDIANFDFSKIQNRDISIIWAWFIDEAGNELSWRDSMTIKNKKITKINNLTRKYNIDIYYIAQRFNDIDIKIRTQFDYVFRPYMRYDKLKNINILKVEINKVTTKYDIVEERLIKILRIEEPFQLLDKIWIWYDTNEIIWETEDNKEAKSQELDNLDKLDNTEEKEEENFLNFMKW